MINKRNAIVLCVGNFDSATGYAWLLIEKLWTIAAVIGRELSIDTIACYPSITEVNPILKDAGIIVYKHRFTVTGLIGCFGSFKFIRNNHVNYLYLSDRPTICWCYPIYHMAGVHKIIIHDHTPGYRAPATGLKKLIKGAINRMPWISADYVIGVSPYVCERLEKVNCVPGDKIKCVTNGISDSRYIKDYTTTRIVSELVDGTEVKSDVVKIVTVARVNRYKGIDFAIRVIHQLISRYNIVDIQYDIIGDGPDIEEFKNLAKFLKVSKFVKFLGKRTDVEVLLPGYDIALHPSRGEAMCLAIIEYMRSALPVVVSTNSSVSSILEKDEDSLFYTEDRLEDCSLKLRGIICSHSLRKRLGLSARRNYLNRYREVTMVSRFEEVLKNIFP